MRDVIKAHAALFFANFFYGINYVVAKGVMPVYISPMALTVLRVVPSAILFWAISSLFIKDKVDKKDLPRLALAGFLGVFVNQVLFLEGLSLSSPIDASIIMTTNPIMVLVIAFFFMKEKLSKVKTAGVFIGALGAIILIMGKGFQGFSPDHIKGDVLLLLNSLSFALYLIVCKPLMEKYNAMIVLKWIFLFGTILYLPFGIGPFLSVQWSNMTPNVFLSLTYIIFITTFLTYLLINYSLTHVKSTVVSMYIYTQPVIAAFVATLVGMDKPTVLSITASILVFVGVYMVSGVNKHIKARFKSKV